jgi:hypothetical protein
VIIIIMGGAIFYFFGDYWMASSGSKQTRLVVQASLPIFWLGHLLSTRLLTACSP